MRATRQDAYDLIHRSALALARVEAAGVKIDMGYLESSIDRTQRRIDKLTFKLQQDRIWRKWKKRFGDKTKLGARQQLGTILFDVMEIPNPHKTLKGKRKVDEEVLEDIDLPFVQDYVKLEKLKKLNNTYLKGVRSEVVNGYLHAFYNAHVASSYRLSSSDPNFQNIPVRDPDIGKIIRSAFIPRKNRTLVEVDFKGAEVCVSACVNHDPVLTAYVTDPSTDMHRDMARQLFKLSKSQIGDKEFGKPIRQEVKGDFVFAQFYGSWYKNCAPKLWKEIGRQKLGLADGTTLFEHLAQQGITELGACDPNDREDPEPHTFECRVREVERDFWGRRFKVYDQWKRDYFEKYQRKGYFDMVTGFRCSGVYSKKQVCNYPIQGPAAHCLLWALIELDAWLLKNKMKTLIIGTIHDSMLLDIPDDELQAVIHKVNKLITKSLPRHWDWITVPLTVEVEGSKENWHAKKPLEIAV